MERKGWWLIKKNLLEISFDLASKWNNSEEDVIVFVMFGLLQVTTVADEGENSFKMPRASVVHMTSTATRPQHMSQVSITLLELLLFEYVFLVFLFPFFFHSKKRRRRDSQEEEISWRPRRRYRRAHFANLHFPPLWLLEIIQIQWENLPFLA